MQRSTAIKLALAAATFCLCSQSSYAENVPPPDLPNAEHVIIDSTVDIGHGGKSFDFNATYSR